MHIISEKNRVSQQLTKNYTQEKFNFSNKVVSISVATMVWAKPTSLDAIYYLAMGKSYMVIQY